MAEGMSIVNLAGLEKPATALIEKISGAVGALFEPRQIKRIAKAEAEAALIRAESQVEITDLHRRAAIRFVNEEAKKQENIESITKKAIPHLDSNAQPEVMDDDWITNFFDKSRIVSDQDMQNLWARVLAGEANSPGSYTKRTVNFISSLDKKDAVLFAKFCSFVWNVGEQIPLIFDVDNRVYVDAGVGFAELTHLDSIGLIRFESVSGFIRRGLPRTLGVLYFGNLVGLSFPNDKDNTMELGKVLLSQVGKELSVIAGSQPNPIFLEYVLERWRDDRLFPCSPLPRGNLGPNERDG